MAAYHSVHNGAHLSKERKAELEKVCEHIAQVSSWGRFQGVQGLRAQPSTSMQGGAGEKVGEQIAQLRTWGLSQTYRVLEVFRVCRLSRALLCKVELDRESVQAHHAGGHLGQVPGGYRFVGTSSHR